MQPLRYGIVGGGFISGFQLRALRRSVRLRWPGSFPAVRPRHWPATRDHALRDGRILWQHQGNGPRARRRDCPVRPNLPGQMGEEIVDAVKAARN